MDVRLPDGTVIKDVPDGTTKADLAAKLKSNGMTVPAEWMAPKQAAEEPGKVESLGAGLGKGFGQVVLGAQGLLGRGVSAVGGIGSEQKLSDLIAPPGRNIVQQAGDWLQRDAAAGRAKLEGELAPYKAANPFTAGAGELGGQIIATAPVGGLLGAGAKAVGATRLGNALASGGMTTGAPAATSLLGKAADLGIRTIGGAATGGVSAGLVDTEQAGTGAIIGGALPSVAKAAGMAGNAIGRVLRGPEQDAATAAAVQAARDAGYVIPPTQARASLGNRLLEGFSGKLTTAQNASAKNQAVTNRLAATTIGLPSDVPITPDALKQVRSVAGQAYDAIAQSGTIVPGQAYDDALKSIEEPFLKAAKAFPNAKPSPVIDLVDSLRTSQFDAAAAVEKIKQLRSAADDAFRAGGPGATDLARASRSAASALEDAIETHLAGTPLLQNFKDARQLIAKTYSVEKAMNPSTGTIDAKKLATQLARGKPLSGELKKAAEFAARFPKASQTPEVMGSLPQASPLDWSAGVLGSLMAGNPAPMLGVAARPAARAAALSGPVQNRLVQGAPINLIGSPELVQLGYRTAPLIGANR